MSVNEPSMEDILASIRRIIAEDQSNGLARSGLSGLTRRSQAAAAPVEDAVPPQDQAATDMHEAPVAPMPHDGEAHAMPQAEAFQAEAASHTEDTHTYETLAQHEPAPDTQSVPVFEPVYEPSHVAMTQEAPDHISYALAEDEGEPLMSPVAGASITSSFQTLAESVMLQDPGLIERVMRESMRPLLKAWLDDHLPSIVERLVRSEIERVARGGRSRNA